MISNKNIACVEDFLLIVRETGECLLTEEKSVAGKIWTNHENQR
jgi:hypothetical protein